MMPCNPVPEEPDYTALSDLVDISVNFDPIVDDSVMSHTLSSIGLMLLWGTLT